MFLLIMCLEISGNLETHTNFSSDDYVLLLAVVDDLQIVRSAVTNLGGRWKDLGFSLGVHADDLDTILSTYHHSPSDCLREMLLKWLRQSYNVCTTINSIPP